MGAGQPGHGLTGSGAGRQRLDRDALLAAGGVAGPAAFVAAWAALGGRADGYDPTRDAISRLAALGAPSRPVMTAGLVALGVGMTLYSGALRARLGGPAWVAAAANGALTLGIAALPLGSTFDTPHDIVAGLGYATLTAVPLLAAPRLAAGDRRAWAAASVGTGVLSGVCLVATLVGSRTGLFQRMGLTLAQAWVVASAVSLARRPSASSTTRRAAGSAGRRH